MSRFSLTSSIVALAFVVPTISYCQATDAVRASESALVGTTFGPGLPPASVVAGSVDLGIAGDFELGGYIFSGGEPFLHNDGGYGYGNTALGLNALVSADFDQIVYPNSGKLNSAFGENALRFSTAGAGNTAAGYAALRYNLTGAYNTGVGARSLFFSIYGSNNAALGADALFNNTDGSYNTANGARSLFHHATGSYNTAIGDNALRYLEYNTAAGGSNNIGIGASSGYSLEEGDNNIYIGSDAGGTVESGQIRIGASGTQTDAFVAGVLNNSITGVHSVFVDADGQLGMQSSSRRYKRDVEDLEPLADRLFELRPVAFRYREHPDDAPRTYGLIAEETAEVLPELVVYNQLGEPETVRYHLLNALLLRELQEQRKLIEAQAARLEELERRAAR
jgi:hypothetical protein